jgi:hypothetical protein
MWPKQGIWQDVSLALTGGACNKYCGWLAIEYTGYNRVN